MKISYRMLIGLMAILIGGTICTAQPAVVRRTSSNLPYRFPQTDAFGNTWMFYHGGRLMQQGNMPFCSDSANLTINGQGVNANVQNVGVEPSGEVVAEGYRTSQFTLTRRFLQSDDGTMRIVDLIRNSTPQELTANLSINTNVNYGVQTFRPLYDPVKKERILASVITDSQGRNELSVYAGKGSKIVPSITAQPNNSSLVQAAFELKIPAGKEVAFVHFHQVGVSADQVEKQFASLREGRALASISPEIRKQVVNYPLSSSTFDDLEILRGGTNDVIELINGDLLKGELAPGDWAIETAVGKLVVPQEQVLGLLVTSGLRPRHLLLTNDGEIIGGTLNTPTIQLQLTSGQKVAVPLSQVSRMGRRSPSNAQAAQTRPTQPLVMLRSGDRLGINLPDEPLRIATRFGTVALPATTIACIDFQPDQTPVHQITLRDGSHFSGLFLANQLDLSTTRGAKITLPVATVRKLAFSAEGDADPESSATLQLPGEDVLAVTLPGPIAIQTTYGPVSINGAEIRKITRVKDSFEDIQITVWDDSVLTGRLEQPYLDCLLAQRTPIRVPVGAIAAYLCPTPQPSKGIVDAIGKLVAQLNADDWKQRERAQADLAAMGPGILPTLRQLREGQPPEAQQRIDTILKQFAKKSPRSPGGMPSVPTPMLVD